MALPPLRGLYILGTLEFPSNSSNVLSAACIVVAGGTLKVGELLVFQMIGVYLCS